jgi:4'-phosphopantetheinyl transferase EntD
VRYAAASRFHTVGRTAPSSLIAVTERHGGSSSAYRMPYSSLFPNHVAVESVDLDDTRFALYEVEERTVSRAVRKRQVEFSAGRHCARLAMTKLGYTACAIPQDSDRSPIWPHGLVGSITHCAGYCAAAVAVSKLFRSLGMDAESVDAASWSLAPQILTETELRWIESLPSTTWTKWLTLIFSAKEAAFKAIYPLEKRILDFRDATVAIDVRQGTFAAEITLKEASTPAGTRIVPGAFCIDGVRVYTASWVLNEAAHQEFHERHPASSACPHSRSDESG